MSDLTFTLKDNADDMRMRTLAWRACSSSSILWLSHPGYVGDVRVNQVQTRNYGMSLEVTVELLGPNMLRELAPQNRPTDIRLSELRGFMLEHKQLDQMIQEKKMPTPMAKLKKFYVGGRNTVPFSGWVKDSLEEAIDHAKKLVESTGEEQYVVKVIRVVRRKPQPIVVETV